MELTNAFVDSLIELSFKAGQAIMEVYHRDFETIVKADGSPVTEADLRSNSIICEGLEQLSSDIPIISEECCDVTHLSSLNERCWLVDPLDGTKEFVHKRREFTTNIALIINNQPILGVIYAPALNELYVGGQSVEAFTIDNTQHKTPLSLNTDTKDGYIILGSRSHKSKQAFANYLDGKPIKEIIPCGSSLKFCKIAKGNAHIYPRLGPTMLWDTAAGQAILESVGGKVLDFSNKPLNYSEQNLKNPAFIASIPQ